MLLLGIGFDRIRLLANPESTFFSLYHGSGILALNFVWDNCELQVVCRDLLHGVSLVVRSGGRRIIFFENAELWERIGDAEGDYEPCRDIGWIRRFTHPAFCYQAVTRQGAERLEKVCSAFTGSFYTRLCGLMNYAF
jgi:hypothetical protein